MTANNPVAAALGACIVSWWQRVEPNSGSCRVVVPAPTARVATDLHVELLSLGLPSYLVTSGHVGAPSPSESARVLRAEAVTSVRDGSFVVVVQPGVLSKLQESIQGSGGGIRSLAVPDEWPWAAADAGFSFFADFFPQWIAASGFPDAERDVAMALLEQAIKATEPMKNRAAVLFDEILGRQFDRSMPPQERADAFAMAVGVPSLNGPSIDGSGVPAAGVATLKEVVDVADAMQGANAREAVDQNAEAALAELADDANRPDAETLRQMVHGVLDRLRTVKDRGRGAIALRGSLPALHDDWRRLTLPVLRRLFVHPVPEAAIRLNAHWALGTAGVHVLLGGKHCVAAHGALPRLAIQIERAPALEATVEIKSGRRLIAREQLAPGEVTMEVTPDLDALGVAAGGTFVVNAMAGATFRSSQRLYLERATNDVPLFVVVAKASRDLTETKSWQRLNPLAENEAADESVDLGELTTVLGVTVAGDPKARVDGHETTVETLAPGIARIEIDPAVLASTGVPPELVVTDGTTSISISIAVEVRRHGPCNLETALAASLQDGSSGTQARVFLEAWRSNVDARPLLGAPGHEEARRFQLVAQSFESMHEPWRPVVLSQGVDGGELRNAGLVRIAANGSTAAGDALVGTPRLAPAARELIRRYGAARDEVIQIVTTRQDHRSRIGLPLYAVASFDYEPGDIFERAAMVYLDAFHAVQEALSASGLGFADRFVLAYLDCVVATVADAQGAWEVVGCAIGPWHPLIIAKRLMVGRGLRHLAELPAGADHRWLKRLGVLLQEVPGFRWFAGMRANLAEAAPLFVDATTDPGWLVAVPATDAGGGSLIWARTLLGLIPLRGGGGEAKGFLGYLGDYARAFPSKRSIVVRASADTPAWQAAEAARQFLTRDGQPSHFGAMLRGGIHVIVDGDGGDPSEYPEWAEPVVCVYPDGGTGFIKQHKVDMLLAQSAANIAFPVQPSGNDTIASAPRGERQATVLQLPVRSLQQTGSGIRDSKLDYTTVAPVASPDCIGNSFERAAALAQAAAGPRRAVGIRTLTPELGSRRSVWTVLPGEGADPAVLLEWARASASSGAPKVLWDYRMAITQASRSYFVLSEIPRTLLHHVASSEVFTDSARAGRALLELASIGLALGSEAFKSHSKALGVTGLVGAARAGQAVLAGAGENNAGEEESHCFLLLPIDSFMDLLGGDLETSTENIQVDYRRGDLVGIACKVSSAGVELAFCSIESKYCSGIYGEQKARSALEQAAMSLNRLSVLATAALQDDALAARLALARLLEFGLRLDANRPPELTHRILAAVLRGEHRVSLLGATGCLVVTTEIALEHSSFQQLDGGVWLRLSPHEWPGEKGDEAFCKVAQLVHAAMPPPWKARPAALVSKAAGAREAAVAVTPKPGNAMPPPETKAETIDGNAANPILAPSVPPALAHRVELLVGVADDGHPAVWRAGANSNHNFMVTGSSGLGKTQLLKSLLWQAREQKLPVLVVDFKNDFAGDKDFLAAATIEAQYVSFDGLPYNPLIPSPQLDPRTGETVYHVSQHITGIAAAFQRTYGLGEQQSAALKDSIRAAFDAAGVASSGITNLLPAAFPDFRIVGEELRERNRPAYNRLDPLFDLEIFRERYQGTGFSSLLGRGLVVDLSSIQAAHIQNTLATLLVYSAHRYLNSLPHSPTVNQLLVFDEAHRVSKSEDIESLVRECRAYGLGIMLSSQYPTDFLPDTASNLATKVLHGNGADVSRVQAIRSALGLPVTVDKRLDMPMFEAVALVKPGQPVFVKTLGYPHRVLLEALADGPVSLDALKLARGLHVDKFEKTLQHLVGMRLVDVDGDVARLAD